MRIADLRRHGKQQMEERSRQRAAEEVLALKRHYLAADDRTFEFEYNRERVRAVFLTAELMAPPALANEYRIHLRPTSDLTVDGQCYVVDDRGRRIEAWGQTVETEQGNQIILETVAPL